ncbi:hypothetical protein [Allochromatium tepidum]|uniref:Uncharacterized protein n=1 Tax=Allochromatium tepidum TaxID=553982 RepID=A0ABM7QL12_9GAMM|nr:hypothetical protein [Allochromatium tepidum]BCU06397.1 hypothetical protein Atep_10740 [Allochromatium tepidum]
MPRASAVLFEVEEVAGHALEDEALQAGQIEQAVVQGLLDGGQERLGGMVRLSSRSRRSLPTLRPGARLFNAAT